MVRFKKGTKVEVFSKKEVAIGAWRFAEIMSGNGHTCIVKFGSFPMSSQMEEVVERVPRKAIRPCPPPVVGMGAWVEGDLVEAFDLMSWKVAIVVEVVDESNFLVQLLGLCKRLYVHKSHLRVRQRWHDDDWFVLGKQQGLENSGMYMGNRQSGIKIKLRVGDDYFLKAINGNVHKHNSISTTSLKRESPVDSYDLGAYQTSACKRRAVGKGCSHQPICLVQSSPTFEKVDAFAYPKKKKGENYVRSSFYDGTTEFSGMVTGSGSDSFLVESASSVDAKSCASSVGSCSVSSSVARNFGFRTEHDDNIEDCHSDAESSNAHEYGENQCSLSSDEDLGAVNRSKFQTYCSIVGGLYASGPLSWEDEEKLTNLRDHL